MSHRIWNTCAAGLALAVVLLAFDAAAANSQKTLEGSWSGTWITPSTGFRFNLAFTVDADGNITGTFAPPGGTPSSGLGGKLTLDDPASGKITGTITFVTTTIFVAQGDVKVSQPGLSGKPNRITGLFITTAFPGDLGKDQLDVSGGTDTGGGGGPPPLPATITSALTASGVVGNDFRYTISAVGGPPIALGATSLPPGLNLVDNAIIGVPSAAGTFAVVLSAANSSGTDYKTLTLTISLPQPPDISLPASINVSTFERIDMLVPVGGTGPFKFTATFPPGLTFVLPNSIQGYFTSPGSYTATIAAENKVGRDEFTLVINVQPMDMNADTNGDGVNNGLALALGLDPGDPAATPFGGASSKGQRPFSLKSSGSPFGPLKFSGSLPVDQGASAVNAPVVVVFGGLVQKLTLGKKGSASVQNGYGLTLKISAKRNTRSQQNVPFTLQLKGNFAQQVFGRDFNGQNDASTNLTIMFLRTVYTHSIDYRSTQRAFVVK